MVCLTAVKKLPVDHVTTWSVRVPFTLPESGVRRLCVYCALRE